MRSLSTMRAHSALLTGFASFVFFALIWHFAGTFGVAESLGLGLFMGVIVAMANWTVTRRRDGGPRP